MAEAFGKVLGLNVFEAYSAGTEERDQINQDAVRLMKEIGIDMELNQHSKLVTAIPEVDIVITMDCNVAIVKIGDLMIRVVSQMKNLLKPEM